MSPKVEIHSFESCLVEWVQRIRPSRILEWGPGRSTQLFKLHAPDAYILSIEHDKSWYDKARKEHGAYADIRHIVLPTLGPTRYAVEPLLSKLQPFDLIFVDGRRRVECLLVASKMLAPGGVVILHDAQREEYAIGLERFTLLATSADKDTSVLSPEAL